MEHQLLIVLLIFSLPSFAQVTHKRGDISFEGTIEKNLPVKDLSVKPNSYFHREYPKVWNRATEYTIAVAEAMPENFYNYRVYPDGMSFKEQQLHIVDNISFLSGLITNETKMFYNKKGTPS